MKALIRTFLPGLLLLVASCDFGLPTGGGTGAEGLTGVIVDPRGNPVSGAVVELYRVSADSPLSSSPAASAITDEAGRYDLKARTHGVYNLSGTMRRHDSVYAVFVRDISIRADVDQGVDTLAIVGSIVLRIASPEGRPVEGVVCGVAASPWRAVSDTAGACRLADMPPGPHDVVVVGTGGVMVTNRITVSKGDTNVVDIVFLDDAKNDNAWVPLMVAVEPEVWQEVPFGLWTRVVVTMTPSAGGESRRDTFNDLVFTTDAVPQTRIVINRIYDLASLRSWTIEVEVQDVTGRVILNAATTLANLEVGETRSVALLLGAKPKPGVPVLLLPLDGQDSVESQGAVVSWNPPPGGTGDISYYVVEVGDDESLSEGAVFRDTLPPETMSWEVPRQVIREDGTLAANGIAPGWRYWWRVSAIGSGVSRSPARSFVTAVVPPPPRELIYPPPSAADIPLTTSLQWAFVPGGIRQFRVQVAEDSLFTSLVDSLPPGGPIPTTPEGDAYTWEVSGLAPATMYFWRVQVIDVLSGGSSMSEVRSFTTVASP